MDKKRYLSWVLPLTPYLESCHVLMSRMAVQETLNADAVVPEEATDTVSQDWQVHFTF